MKNKMPLDGLGLGHDSGSVHCDMLKMLCFRTAWGGCFVRNLWRKSCLRCCLRQEIICNSGRQQTKSLTKISTENALEYLAFGKNFNGDRLTARNLNENLKNNL